MVLTRAQNQPGRRWNPGHRRRHAGHEQQRFAVDRPEPDVLVACVASGLPSRVRERRQGPAGRDGQAARRAARCAGRRAVHVGIDQEAGGRSPGYAARRHGRHQCPDGRSRSIWQVHPRSTSTPAAVRDDNWSRRGLPHLRRRPARRRRRLRGPSTGTRQRGSFRHALHHRHRPQRRPQSAGHRQQPRDAAGRSPSGCGPCGFGGLCPPATRHVRRRDARRPLHVWRRALQREHRTVGHPPDLPLRARSPRRRHRERPHQRHDAVRSPGIGGLADARWLERRATVPSRPLRQRDGVPAPRLRRVRSEDPAGHPGVRGIFERHQPGDSGRVRKRRLPLRPLDARRGRRSHQSGRLGQLHGAAARVLESPRAVQRARHLRHTTVQSGRSALTAAGSGFRRHGIRGSDRQRARRVRHGHAARQLARVAARPRDPEPHSGARCRATAIERRAEAAVRPTQ